MLHVYQDSTKRSFREFFFCKSQRVVYTGIKMLTKRYLKTIRSVSAASLRKYLSIISSPRKSKSSLDIRSQGRKCEINSEIKELMSIPFLVETTSVN